MATCAACQQPIIARQQVRVVGCEVVHAICVGRKTIGDTMREGLARVEARIAALEAEGAALHGEARRAMLDVTRLREELGHRVREEQATLRALDTSNRERDAAIQERDRLRTENQALRARPLAPTANDSEDQVDNRDPFVVRASLLELD